jgi:hypothetical protein
MIKRLIFSFLPIVLLVQFAVSTAYAMGEPAGNCAPGFTLEMAMDHDNHHHKHVGSDADQNGDGYICVQPVTPNENIHVHVDNVVQ